MHALSNLNDIAGLWITLLIVGSATTLLVLLSRKRSSVSVESLGISTRSYWLSLLGAALWMSVVFLFLQPDYIPWGGGDRYFPRAANIVEHGVFGTGTRPTALFPPGYSFLLVPAVLLLGDSPWTFFLTNFLLLAGASIVVRAILPRLGLGSRLANLLAAALVLYPNRLLGTLLPFSDIPFSLFWAVAFALVLASNRSPRSALLPALAGCVAGAAALVRSNGLLYIAPLLAGFLVSETGPKARRAVLFLGLSAAVVIPWSARNTQLFDMPVAISTNGGYNVLVGHNPTAGAGWNRYVDTSSAVAAALREALGDVPDEARLDRFYLQLGLSNILADPGRAMLRAVAKIAKTFCSDGYTFGLLETYTNAREITLDMVKDSPRPQGFRRFFWALHAVYYHALFIVSGILYIVLAALTAWRLWADRRGRTDAWWVMVLLLACIAFTVTLTFGLSRLKEPVTAAMLIYWGTRQSIAQTRP